MENRERKKQIIKDLEKKIVLLSGPRQVGKTTLSKNLCEHFVYLNYDNNEHRKIIREKSWSRDTDLVIFDELHKMRQWKTWIKGIYDTEGNHPQLLVTGSARLDIFRKGGDSLAGRHFLHRLHPFSIAELKKTYSPKDCLERLLLVGGFPEPFLEGSVEYAQRWRSTHLDRVLKEDLLELEPVRSIKSIEILVDLLADRVGSTVSYASLARDLEVSPHSVKKWIGILESLFVIFVVPPYGKNIARALLKEPKIYFYDTGRITNGEAARLENVVACALWKSLQAEQDLSGEKNQLYYLRDKEKREVDFLTFVQGKVREMIEVKWADEQPAPSLKYFSERVSAQTALQLVKNCRMEKTYGKIAIKDLANWLAQLKE